MKHRLKKTYKLTALLSVGLGVNYYLVGSVAFAYDEEEYQRDYIEAIEEQKRDIQMLPKPNLPIEPDKQDLEFYFQQQQSRQWAEDRARVDALDRMQEIETKKLRGW